MAKKNDYQIINVDEAAELIMKEDAVFIKESIDSCGGKGVKFLKTKNLDKDKILSALRSMGDDVIVQAPIRQHPLLSRLNSSSVNTIRMVSLLRKDGSIKIYSTVLRMGIGGAIVDNASSGGITCGITENGILKEVAYRIDGKKYMEHPDTHVKFNTIQLPDFDKLKDDIKLLHPYFAHYRLISWDIAYDEDGKYILVEANLKHGELDFHQLNNGPLFGEDTEEILKEVYGAKK